MTKQNNHNVHTRTITIPRYSGSMDDQAELLQCWIDQQLHDLQAQGYDVNNIMSQYNIDNGIIYQSDRQYNNDIYVNADYAVSTVLKFLSISAGSRADGEMVRDPVGDKIRELRQGRYNDQCITYNRDNYNDESYSDRQALVHTAAVALTQYGPDPATIVSLSYNDKYLTTKYITAWAMACQLVRREVYNNRAVRSNYRTQYIDATDDEGNDIYYRVPAAIKGTVDNVSDYIYMQSFLDCLFARLSQRDVYMFIMKYRGYTQADIMGKYHCNASAIESAMRRVKIVYNDFIK